MKDRIDELLSGVKSVLITAHRSPDSDAISSVLAMQFYINKYHEGINADIYLEAIAEPHNNYMQGYEDIHFVEEVSGVLSQYELIIYLDVNERDRAINLGEGQEPPISICIDHHKSEPDKFTYYYCEKDSLSLADLLARNLFSEEDFKDRNLSEILMVGIIGDSGGFKFVNPTNTDILGISATIIKNSGLQIEEVSNKISSISEIEFEVVKRLVANTQNVSHAGYKFTYTTISVEEIMEIGATDEEVKNGSQSYMFNFLRNIRDYPWGFLVRPRPSDVGLGYKATFRSSRGGVIVREIAEKFGGGGHDPAAGCKFSMEEAPTLDAAVRLVLDTIEEMDLKPIV